MSQKSKKSGKNKSMISPSQRIIKIDHVLGERTFTQKLTIPKKRPFKNVFQFKCALRETKPPVWRRIQVPENYTFYDLHVALQDAMDWLDYHLHCFRIPGIGTFEDIAHIECPWWDPWDMDEDWLLTTEVPLKDFFKKPKDRAVYCYDYGDCWEMNITMEKVFPKEKNVSYPMCVGGKLAAPPEDCGSIPGYYHCIEAFEKADKLDELPDTEENEELWERLEWLGDWNPHEFDPKKVLFNDPRERFLYALGMEEE